MKLLTALTAVALTTAAVAQTKMTTEEAVRKVADHVIETTSFQFVNTKTGEKFASTKSVTPSPDVKADSKFNKWMYVNGVLNIGMVQLSSVLNDAKYTDYSRKNYAFIFDNLDFYKKQFDAGTTNTEWSAVFKLGSLDACGAMSAALLDVYAVDKRKDYMDYLQRVSDYIINKQVKFPDGTLARNSPRKMTLWADDLFMSVPYIARMGKLTGDSKYFDFAIKQVESFNRYIYDSTTGLYFHCFYNDENTNGVARWGRCNGWLAMAQAELLTYLPANHPKRAELIRLLQRQIIGFARYQDGATGLWHQVLDKQDSYLETSVTSMFVYAVAKAVNNGWINPRYISIAQNGWEGLLNKTTANGEIQDICIGTSIEEDVRYYYTRPKELNDTHGIGAYLMAGAEMLKAKDKLVKDIEKRR